MFKLDRDGNIVNQQGGLKLHGLPDRRATARSSLSFDSQPLSLPTKRPDSRAPDQRASTWPSSTSMRAPRPVAAYVLSDPADPNAKIDTLGITLHDPISWQLRHLA